MSHFSIMVFFLSTLVWSYKSNGVLGLGTNSAPRAFFVFGDSLVDNGNNNFLVTSARADLPPYGIDYPSHRPTGRFSNGKNLPDIIAEHIGVEPLLPYFDPDLKGQKLLNGANFASAGVGILNDTGIQFVNIVRMPYQLANFARYQKNLVTLIGIGKTKKLVNEALILISCGGNDFVNNYYLVPSSLRSIQYTIPNYVQFLIFEYQKVLTRLYELGARKVLVLATGPLGCAPSIRALHSWNGECATQLQQAAILFNHEVTTMIDFLNKKLGTNAFVSVEAHHIYMDFMTKPIAFGFKVADRACCGQGPYNGLGICTALSNLCSNRDSYVYWDGYHPSERACQLIVQEIFNGSKYVNPMNLSTFMAMDSIRA